MLLRSSVPKEVEATSVAGKALRTSSGFTPRKVVSAAAPRQIQVAAKFHF